MNNAVVVPAQIRAGRALLEWSQEQLAKEAEVGLSTVRDTESEKRAADTGAVASIRRALENGGVVFTPGSPDAGPGIRLVANRPNIIRRPTTMQKWEGMPFTVERQGKAITVVVTREVLEDLDGLSGTDEEDIYLKTFDRHRGKILDAAALAMLEPENFDNYGRLYIRNKDVEAISVDRWFKVVINSSEDIRDMEGEALINRFIARLRAAGAPRDAEVWRDTSVTDGHAFYFSPKATAIAHNLLGSFDATACATPPNLAVLKKLLL
jgi:transcriptional regulator with XRE-family HTH domain